MREYVVVAGAIRGVHDEAGETIGTFATARVYQGVVPPEMPVRGGGGGDCTIPLSEGMLFVGVATIAQNRLEPMLCLPFGDMRDEGGRGVLVEVQAALGPGVPPGVDPSAEEPQPAPLLDLSTLALGAVGVVVALVAIVVIGNFARRRDGADLPPS
jgi:hypothetical protein